MRRALRLGCAVLILSACGRCGGASPPTAPRSTTPPARGETTAPAPADVGDGPAPPALPPAAAGSPDLEALLAMLGTHRDVPFDAAARERGCPSDQSLGEY